MKTEAALLVEPGRPLVVAEIEVPPLREGQVLVELAYSGACGTQLMEVDGGKGEDKWCPHCLGHEGTGSVIDVYSTAAKVRPGDKVVLSWIRSSGIEAGGSVYGWNGANVNAGGVTTFQRYAVVSENRLTLLPADVGMDVGILLGCAAPTGMGAIFNVLRIEPGNTVVIFGTGGIGLNAIMAAVEAGGNPIIGVDLKHSRRELARAFGATHVVDPTKGDIRDQIAAIAPQGVDVAVEATGNTIIMAEAAAVIRAQGGRTVIIGNAPHNGRLILNPSIFNQGKSMLGTWGGDSVPDRDYNRYARLLVSPRFPIRQLLSSPYRLQDINQALADLRSGKIGRPLIDVAAS